MIVERAKAEAESKRLQGQGIADQRREIARGLEDSVKVLNGVDINSQEASALIVVTQHYDTLQSVGSASNSNLILMPNSPQAGSEMLNNMVASFTASNQIGEEMKKAKKAKDTLGIGMKPKNLRSNKTNRQWILLQLNKVLKTDYYLTCFFQLSLSETVLLKTIFCEDEALSMM